MAGMKLKCSLIILLGLGSALFAQDEVTFIDSAKVHAAFEKGGTLLDAGAYKILASHRDGAGQVEVHATDTDIIHFLKGTATFITGGTVVDGKTTAPGEIRGTSITGGTPHMVHPGDIMVVPNGTPHWFEKVDAPFDYFVVKVKAK